MTSTRQYGQCGLLILAAGIALAAVGPAGAQVWPKDMKADPPAAQTGTDPDADADAADPETPATDSAAAKDAETKDTATQDAAIKDDAVKDADGKPLELDWSQLNVDPSTLTWAPASKARVAPKTVPGTDAAWSESNKPNGSSDVSVKQSLSAFLDAKVGADMTVTGPPQTLTEAQLLSDRLANGGSLPQSSGTAWAGITAPGAGPIWDKTTIEARVDPSQDQTRLGTSLSKSLPFGEQYSLSLENGYNLIEQGVVPVPGIIGRPAQNYATDQSAKLSINQTGTSFSAGQSLSSSDDRWLRKVGAEQKLFGGVSISGSIGETPLGTTNKSVTAGFKQSW
jgi:hypothetical protein